MPQSTRYHGSARRELLGKRWVRVCRLYGAGRPIQILVRGKPDRGELRGPAELPECQRSGKDDYRARCDNPQVYARMSALEVGHARNEPAHRESRHRRYAQDARRRRTSLQALRHCRQAMERRASQIRPHPGQHRVAAGAEKETNAKSVFSYAARVTLSSRAAASKALIAFRGSRRGRWHT
jgi:hypothetical protein